MDRRDFLKRTIYTASMMGAALYFTLPASKAFASSAALTNRVLVNVMLLGGADLRFLLVPEPGTPYADKFWEKRKSLYVSDTLYPSYQACFDDLYDSVESHGTVFGIHKKAGWLKDQFDDSNVAIVANVYGSTNRRHDHSQLIVNTGDPFADQYNYDREGWGGRFSASVNSVSGADANAVAVSRAVPIFCKGLNSANRLEKVVHVRNARNFALPMGDTNVDSKKSVLGRALKMYYGGRRPEIEVMIENGELPVDWPYRKFFDHENSIRSYGDMLETRLQEVKPNRHVLIRRLSSASYKDYNLNSKYFGMQLANLYDCMFVADILQLRTAYMEYGSWDHHRRLKYYFERNLEDVFGRTNGTSTGGFHNLTAALDSDVPGANENIVYVFSSDFGRQLVANGDSGTDHGIGSYSIVVGRGVIGGVYGEMFPQSEIADLGDGTTRFDKQGADIEGRTSFEHILGATCDWVEEGTSSFVFPALNSVTQPPLEQGVDPATLFKPGHAIAGELTGTRFPWRKPPITIKAEKLDSAVTQVLPVSQNVHYWMEGLSDGSYQVTAEVDPIYFSIETPAQVIVLAGDNVSGIDFQVKSNLHVATLYKYNSSIVVDNGDGTFTRIPTFGMYLLGYNYLQGTQVTIGGHAVNFYVSSSGFMSVTKIPVDFTGDIVITTDVETYTFATAFEDVLAGAWNSGYV